jgi:hypothetical protein
MWFRNGTAPMPSSAPDHLATFIRPCSTLLPSPSISSLPYPALCFPHRDYKGGPGKLGGVGGRWGRKGEGSALRQGPSRLTVGVCRKASTSGEPGRAGCWDHRHFFDQHRPTRRSTTGRASSSPSSSSSRPPPPRPAVSRRRCGGRRGCWAAWRCGTRISSGEQSLISCRRAEPPWCERPRVRCTLQIP